jgi:outer membrane receptor protein involved in Fe transport
MTTQINTGSARIQGVELNVRHSLAPLGPWGRHLIAFANATRLQLEGDADADFTDFLPESVNWGLTFTRQRLTVITKWNYRGSQRGVAFPSLGPAAYRHPQPRLQLDVSADYRFSRRFSLFCNLRNATNAMQEEHIYGPETPRHAREFLHARLGRVFTLGLKGSF